MAERARPPAAFESSPRGGTEPFDPLRICVYTTIAVLSWLLTPYLVASGFAGIGVVAYLRARRQGLVRSRCKLGDTRLVITYLVVVLATGVGFTIRALINLF